MSTVPPDFDRLLAGEKAAWDRFVARYAGLIVAALRDVVQGRAEIEDLAQEVLLRLCRNDFDLLRRFDPAKAGLGTWLTIIARSTAHDILRRKRLDSVPIEQVPEAALGRMPDIREKIRIPPGLLTERQALVLAMLYDREMDVPDVAAALEIDPQTVRSTHHKALVRLRAHFAEIDAGVATLPAGRPTRP